MKHELIFGCVWIPIIWETLGELLGLEGQDIAGQTQSLDGICVHHHPFHLVTAEG